MMHTTCLNSAASLRCTASRSSSFNDPTCFFDARFETNALLISSSFDCCCCCCCCTSNNSIYNRLPRINPSFLYSGLRQSTLIQFSPSRKSTFHGRRRKYCYSTSSLTESDRTYYYEKLYSFKERRKFGKGGHACGVFEDKRNNHSFSNGIDDGYIDDVEVLLDLLAEEVGLEHTGVTDRKRVEKKVPHYVTSKTKVAGSVNRNLKCDDEVVKNKRTINDRRVVENKRIRNDRREEERGTFLKGVNWKKQGSSCSSYYSVSSKGESKSDNNVEIEHDDCLVRGESSSEYKDDQNMDSYRSYDEKVEGNVDSRDEFSKEQSEILKKNTTKSYYADQEWRKKSEKKLNVESSQHQSQVSVSSEQNSQQYSKKADRITDQSESRMQYKRPMETLTGNAITELSSTTQKRYNDAESKLNTSVQMLTSEQTADRVTRHEEYIRQSNLVSEASGVNKIDQKDASSSSSSLETRMKNWEDKSTEISGQFEDKREEKQQRIEHLTTTKDSRLKSHQIYGISDTHISNVENTSVSNTQSNIRSRTQELHLETSNSEEKAPTAQHVALRRETNKDNFSSSEGYHKTKERDPQTGATKSGRRTTKASSFHVGMQKEASSSYKALKLNPEPNSQESDTRKNGSLQIVTASSAQQISEGQSTNEHSSERFETITGEPREQAQESSRIQQSEILRGVAGSDAIASADQQQKSSSHFVGEFVKKAKHELSASKKTHEAESMYENAEQDELKSSGSGHSNQKDGVSGPSAEMWHVTGGAPTQQFSENDAHDNMSSIGNEEIVKRRGRTWWNVIGDVVRLRWQSPHSETHTPKSGGGKVLSNQSSSEAWFSGHEPEDSNDENARTGSTKGRSRSQKEISKEKVENEGLDSPLILSSSSNTNQGSFLPLPAIRMRRSPAVKITSGIDETDASGSGSGKIVVLDQPAPESQSKEGELNQRKLARIDQVSKDRFDEWEEAYTFETKQRKIDEFFMREALLEAKKGADFWEVPVGAVLVQDGKIVARGYNLVEELRDSTAHAEMICIREASNNLRSWRLSGTTLYVTLEPCPMCAGAILQARIDILVWGAPNKLLGADGSWIRLFPDGDGGNGSDKPAAPVHPFHPNMTVRRGVLSSECADAMQQFFHLRRKKKEKRTEAEPSTSTPSSSTSGLSITHHHRSKFFGKMHDAFSIMFCL